MTVKRAAAALVGLALVVGVAQAGWFLQAGRWYYTPDIGSEVTFTNLTGSVTNVVWNLQVKRYAFACLNPAGNEASETVMVATVELGSSATVDNSGKKKKRSLTLTTDINTDSLASPDQSIYCINPNWHPDPDSVLVYEFDASVRAYSCQGSDCSNLESETNYSCVLEGPYSPTNLPPGGTDYTCSAQ